jgi:ABC-type dipeptide/oligopeptide/nickel transport system ATPase component
MSAPATTAGRQRQQPEAPVLTVTDLRTHFHTRDGVVRAVDGVSLSLERGETLGVVGESGCGKSVTALSVMRLVPAATGRIVAGSIRLRVLNSCRYRRGRCGRFAATGSA